MMPVKTVGKARDEIRVQLDYHLVHTEHKSSMWRQLLGQHHFRAENIADLMELIYFLWFEACQLPRCCPRCDVCFPIPISKQGLVLCHSLWPNSVCVVSRPGMPGLQYLLLCSMSHKLLKTAWCACTMSLSAA